MSNQHSQTSDSQPILGDDQAQRPLARIGALGMKVLHGSEV